jgi:hypothetical protein
MAAKRTKHHFHFRKVSIPRRIDRRYFVPAAVIGEFVLIHTPSPYRRILHYVPRGTIHASTDIDA